MCLTHEDNDMTNTYNFSTLDVALASMAITRQMPHDYVTDTWPGIFTLPAIRKAAKDAAKQYPDANTPSIDWIITERGDAEHLIHVLDNPDYVECVCIAGDGYVERWTTLAAPRNVAAMLLDLRCSDAKEVRVYARSNADVMAAQ